MTVYYADIADVSRYPAKSPPEAGQVMCVRFKYTVPAAGFADADLLHLAPLPGNSVPIDFEMYLEDLDSGSGLDIDVGIVDTTGAALVAGSLFVDGETTAGQAAGYATVDKLAPIYKTETWLAESDCLDVDIDKMVAMLVNTNEGTATGGLIFGMLWYRSIEHFDKP
ncbi:MAG: hypothetical protein GY861_28315 [bacterium]|nr:hypothetical protein [bacterium]